jgi:hypothetical protein
MITLFVFVVIATLVLAVIRAEGMRPLGLALVGTISLVLGVGTTAIFTETSLAPLVNSMVFAQEADTTDQDAVGPTEDQPKTESPKTESPVSESPSSESPSSESPVSESPVSESPVSETSVVEATPIEETTDDETDVVTADETATEESVEADSDAAGDNTSPSLTENVTVEKITNIEYLDRENAPSWLEAKPWTDDGVHFVPVESRLQILETDCVSALEEKIQQRTDAYINRFLRNKHATTLLNLGSAVPNRHIAESFEERVVVTEGSVFYQTHALLSFDDNFRAAVMTEWDEVRATSRLMQTGLGVGIVILLLSTMFSYFKLDTATRGYYTGRLQFAAAAAILTVIVASVLFANHVPWM